MFYDLYMHCIMLNHIQGEQFLSDTMYLQIVVTYQKVLAGYQPFF